MSRPLWAEKHVRALAEDFTALLVNFLRRSLDVWQPAKSEGMRILGARNLVFEKSLDFDQKQVRVVGFQSRKTKKTLWKLKHRDFNPFF